MPPDLIEKNERMSAGRHRKREFRQMESHGLGVARGKNEPGTFALGGANGAGEAIFAKSKAYVQRALRCKKADDLDEYQLWASLALELLGKTCLARIHPSLIANPQDQISLFAASGLNLGTDIKTIATHTLYDRLRHITKGFDESVKKFCDDISQRRNAELHSGEVPFKEMKLEAWESRYWCRATHS
jgi:hypothetical protein